MTAWEYAMGRLLSDLMGMGIGIAMLALMLVGFMAVEWWKGRKS